VERIVSGTAPGSFLAISHVTDEATSPELREAIVTTYAQAPAPLYLRDRERIRSLFGGRNLLEPGLVDVHDWRPSEHKPPIGLRLFGGVAPLG
jgi:hypothetical protein